MTRARPHRTLSHEEARTFYDRFGRRQDLQRIYEDPAIKVLEDKAALEGARAVVEFGAGTGRLARRWLERRLPIDATYLGLDLSSTMVELARGRLTAWAERARVLQTDGSIRLPVPDAGCDRLVSVYVLDLLSEAEIAAFVDEARRVLAPGGLLCLASLTEGRGPVSRAVTRLWCALHTLRPQLVGGCRPIRLLAQLDERWRIMDREIVCTLGLCTEVLIAGAR